MSLKVGERAQKKTLLASANRQQHVCRFRSTIQKIQVSVRSSGLCQRPCTLHPRLFPTFQARSLCSCVLRVISLGCLSGSDHAHCKAGSRLETNELGLGREDPQTIFEDLRMPIFDRGTRLCGGATLGVVIRSSEYDGLEGVAENEIR
jgi:hypothetical protein